MELHRCRFFHYTPTAINSLAFNPDASLFAVARANADIEIWNVKQDWHQQKRVAGGEGKSVESLSWSSAGRLFSAGHFGSITEWDLFTLQPKQMADSYGGAVWSIASNASSTVLAAGCEDGSVRLFDISEGDLRYIRSLEAKKGRILSVCWGPSMNHAGQTGQTLATGSSEGVIRLWNTQTGRTIQHFTVPFTGSTPAMIWAVTILSDGTVVSGDSQGNVAFWDGATGTLTQSITSHIADVLCLVASAEGDCVYASGPDNKIVQIRALPSKIAATGVKWVVTGSSRAHSHDVRALAISPNPNIDLIVSGGVDTTLITYTQKEYPRGQQRKLMPFPHRPIVSLSKEKRVLCCQNAVSIELWGLGRSLPSNGVLTDQTNKTVLPLLEGHHKIAELRIKSQSSLVCSAISADATWLACSDASMIRIYRLSHHIDGSISVRLLNTENIIPDAVLYNPAHVVMFSPDSRKLIIAHVNGTVAVLLLHDEGTVETVRVFNQHKDDESSETICSLAISADGQWLVSGDLANNIHVFNLDSLKFHSSLPIFSSQHTTLAFHPLTAALVIACCDNHFYIYNVEEKRLSDWSKAHQDKLPNHFLKLKDKITGISFNPARPLTAVLWGIAYMCEVDLEKPLPPVDAKLQIDSNSQPTKGSKNRKRGLSESVDELKLADDIADEEEGEDERVSDNFRMSSAVQPCLFLDFLGPNELVAIQRPWIAVIQQFPPKLYRPRYGT